MFMFERLPTSYVAIEIQAVHVGRIVRVFLIFTYITFTNTTQQIIKRY